MKKIIFVIVVSFTLYSCVIGLDVTNKQGHGWDVDEVISIPDSMFTVKEFYDRYEKKYFPISGLVRVQFSGGSVYSDSNTVFKYLLGFYTHALPTIKLNSLSFTDKKGKIITSFLYYKTDTNGKTIRSLPGLKDDTNNMVINIIDSFPAIFSKETNTPFEIIAESTNSYREAKPIYVNCDIEVGNKHYIKHIKYKRKLWFTLGRP